MKMVANTQAKQYLVRIKQYIVKHDLALALVIVAVVISAGLFIGYSNNGVIPTYSNAHYHYREEPSNLLSYVSNWDGPDYLHIARHGYGHNLFYANFFPLYPLLIHLFNLIIPSTIDSALLISWLCFIGAVYFYIRLSKMLLKTNTIDSKVKAVLPFILFPSGVFLFATYSESLYAFLALAAIYLALNKKYWVAAVLVLLCGLTHITGGFLLVLILLIMYEQKERLSRIIIAGLIGISGLLAYMAYSLKEFNNPIAFIQSQEKQHGWLKHSFFSLIGRADLLNVLFIVLLLTSTVYWWNRRRSFSIYSFLFLLIPLVGRQYGGFNRYVLMAFPLQFMIYEYFSKKSKYYLYLIIGLGVSWTYFTLQYMSGYIGN
jgi:Gpi18-like mannosyltransferase